MKRAGLSVVAVVGFALALGLGAGIALAQDPVAVAPNAYKVILENDRVRVLSVTVEPGGKTPMHSHPANVVYALDDASIRFTMPDGKTVDATMKAGDAMWSGAQEHAGENTGKKPVRVLVVELKK